MNYESLIGVLAIWLTIVVFVFDYNNPLFYLKYVRKLIGGKWCREDSHLPGLKYKWIRHDIQPRNKIEEDYIK